MGFWFRKCLIIMVLFLVAVSDRNQSVVKLADAAGRPFSVLPQQEQGFSKILATTMGIECKCCDGIGGECISSWTHSCSTLHCSPWKYF